MNRASFHVEYRESPNGHKIKLKSGRVINGFWYICGRVNGVRQKPIAAGTADWRVAEKMAMVREVESIKGSVFGSSGLSLKKAVDEFLENHKPGCQGTIDLYRNHLGIFLEHYPEGPHTELSDIAKVEMKDFRNLLLETKSKTGRLYTKNGVRMKMISICTFFSYWVERKKLSENPCTGVLDNFEAEEVARYLTDEEQQKLANACDPNDPNIQKRHARWRTQFWEIVTFGMLTGARISRAVLATKENYNEVTNEYFIGKLKRGNNVTAIVHPQLRPFFDRIESGRLWPEQTIRRVQNMLSRTWKRANVGRVRFHDFRHTYASNMLDAGATPAELQEALGHRSLTTTMRYMHARKKSFFGKTMALKTVPIVSLFVSKSTQQDTTTQHNATNGNGQSVDKYSAINQ